jgi:hypothetical protein
MDQILDLATSDIRGVVHFTYVTFLLKESLKFSMIYCLNFSRSLFAASFLSKDSRLSWERVDFLPNILAISPSLLLLYAESESTYTESCFLDIVSHMYVCCKL